MSQSLLLQIARNSIIEVFEAKHIIDKNELLQNYPVLKQSYPSFITLYLGDELRGSYGSISANKTLLEDIMHHAKAAAFEDERFTPLKTSEFLHCSIELSLLSEPEEISYTDIDDLREKVRVGKDGLILILGDKEASFLPQIWSQLKTFDNFLTRLLNEAGLSIEDMRHHPKIYSFQIEKERDEPILK
jgi:AmmeMemoRadiSam system protein A